MTAPRGLPGGEPATPMRTVIAVGTHPQLIMAATLAPALQASVNDVPIALQNRA
jgi:hypothetical protein